ncbi:MAG: NUDIX hydrolase [Ardenticatenaceae bacterium]
MSEEYFDVVDENNVVVGQEKRRMVHETGGWHRGSHVFLFTPEGRLVIQRRSRTKDLFPGAIDCSVSEHLQVGESYFDGAIRGLQEELGLQPLPLRRLLQFKMNYGPNDNMISELYEAVCHDQSLTIDLRETEEIAYHTIPEIEEMMTSGQVPFAPWFVQLFRWYIGKPAKMDVIWANLAH